MKEFDKKEFDRLAAEWRYVITDMICRAGSGHLGGALSLVEVLITLYYRIMKVDPENPKWEGRDRFVLSKGHAAPVLYTALAYKGFFPASWLATLNKNATKLPSHADARTVPGVDATTGSLGQGFSLAVGKALAAKRDKKSYNVFCILGDGECDEGQVWEAAMFAGHHRLDNIIGLIDYNKLQIEDSTYKILDLEPFADKWRSFGWEAFEMDGHDWDDIYNTITKAISIKDKPVMIITHTIKGKGICELENKPQSHNIKVPDKATYDKYINALGEIDFELPYKQAVEK